jgi:hypothetical protein
MFGSDVLDIVVGMVFIFLLLSLICSALQEFIETLVKKRAKDLERGIRELIGDPDNSTDFIEKIYNHALVNSLYRGRYSADKKSCLPSYIPSANFAIAVMDLIRNPPAEGIKLPANIKGAYAIFEQRAAGDAARLQASLEEWFNTGMDRVSGWYKRRAQWILVALGLLIAVAINADTISIAQRLSNDSSLRKELVAMAEAKANQQLATANNAQISANPAGTGSNPTTAGQNAAAPAQAVNGGAAGTSPAGTDQPAATTATAPAAVSTPAPAAAPLTIAPSVSAPLPGGSVQQIQQYTAQLDQIGLPIGWHAPQSATSKQLVEYAIKAAPGEVKKHGIGWILTAIAISMGAPFWFDLLDKIISVRTALKPQSGN